MRYASDRVITGFSIVTFAVATALAPKAPFDSATVISRADSDQRVVLQLNLAPVALASLPALDESSLFGIKVEPRAVEVLAADEAPPAATAVAEAPRKRIGSRRERHLASRSRHVGPEAVASAPAPTSKADPAVADVEAPAWRPRSSVALAPEEAASGRAGLGFTLNERASLSVGPLSSMTPSYASDAGHGDLNERWRLRDDDDASRAPGAAVGMTFKLN
ncbi:MAG: hypothetical protein SGI91_05425 [Alphaproteobacteria bacterium]|nr:hypothetical protein [Alphaproteobacteria bacterium]